MIDIRATAADGTLYINDTNEHTGTFAFINVLEADTKISECKDSDGNDLLSDMGITDTDELPIGIYVPISKKLITSITLSAGKINLIIFKN